MLRMDGTTEEGRAYGPFPVAPSHPVQSASARLHARRVWNGRRKFKGAGRGGDKLDVVAGGCFDLVEIRCTRRHVRFGS